MTRQEMHERYYRAQKEAESELQCWIHALTTEADVLDRITMAGLWRTLLEGNAVTPTTFEMMLEATNT